MTQKSPAVASIITIALHGFDGGVVRVETDIRAGLPLLRIVGMGNKAVTEAQHRVRSAVQNTGLQFPAKKLTVNLSPAELPKQGAHFDLPIAISVLQASGQLNPRHTRGCAFIGELSLSGDLLPVRGATLAAELARSNGIKQFYVPAGNYAQATLIEGIDVIPVSSLREAFQRLIGIAGAIAAPLVPPTTGIETALTNTLDSISGQDTAKRALMIAIAGKHNILLSGPPGTGKTHLARASAALIPPLTAAEAIEVTKLHGLAEPLESTVRVPPLRSPHHSVTRAAFIGGGARPTPGDISLAHKGILLLDEIPEYPRSIIESLRQPLEDKKIILTRLSGAITYPADNILIGTMNPCPCGFYEDPDRQCRCSPGQIAQYRRRLSGPLLDRIDLFVTVSRTKDEYFFDPKTLIKTQHSTLVEMVKSIRRIQNLRYKRSDYYNGNADAKVVQKTFQITKEAHAIARQAQQTLGLSPRGVIRAFRVARTIADAAESPKIEPAHIAEALQFRDTLYA